MRKRMWVGAGILGAASLAWGVAGKGAKPCDASLRTGASTMYVYDVQGNVVEIRRSLGDEAVQPIPLDGKAAIYEYEDHCTLPKGDGVHVYVYDAQDCLTSLAGPVRDSR